MKVTAIREKPKRKPLRMFRVLQGTHYERGVRFTKGQIVYTERNLKKVHANKFERVWEEELLQSPHREDDEDEGDVEGTPLVKKFIPEGMDNVSDEFPLAKSYIFNVYENDDGYHVADARKPLEILSKTPLARKEVVPFIKELVEKGN